MNVTRGVILLAALLPFGCGSGPDGVWPDRPGPKVVVSFAPVYCWAVNVAGDDAVVKNMFGHAGISKRCAYVASNHDDLRRLGAIVTHLDRHELGLLPVSWRYRARLVLAYVRRWREIVVYAQALWLMKVRRLPIWLVEEAILKRSA